MSLAKQYTVIILAASLSVIALAAISMSNGDNSHNHVAEAAAGATAKTPKRIAGTIAQASVSHDADGHSLHQAVYFVHPEKDYVYRGAVTFTSSRGVDIFVYHDVTGKEDSVSGLKLHTLQGRTYAVTTAMKNATAGTVEFVGAGILAHVHVDEGGPPGDFNIAASIDAQGKKKMMMMLLPRQ